MNVTFNVTGWGWPPSLRRGCSTQWVILLNHFYGVPLRPPCIHTQEYWPSENERSSPPRFFLPVTKRLDQKVLQKQCYSISAVLCSPAVAALSSDCSQMGHRFPLLMNVRGMAHIWPSSVISLSINFWFFFPLKYLYPVLEQLTFFFISVLFCIFPFFHVFPLVVSFPSLICLAWLGVQS